MHRHRLCWSQLIVPLLALVLSAASGAQVSAGAEADAIKKAYTAFAAGDLAAAKKQALVAVPAAHSNGSVQTLETLALFAELCIRGYDLSCADNYNLEVLKLLGTLPVKDRLSTGVRSTFLGALARGLRASLASGNEAVVNSYLQTVPQALQVTPGIPTASWIDASLAMGEAHLSRLQRREAQPFIERAWIQFLGLPFARPLDALHFIPRFTNAFLGLGQTKRAWDTAVIGWPLVEKVGHLSRYDSFTYLIVMGDVQQKSRNMRLALVNRRAALDQLTFLHFEQDGATAVKRLLEARLLIDCMQQQDDECRDISDVALRHRAWLEGIYANRPPLKSFSHLERLSAIASTLTLAAIGEAPPGWLREVFKNEHFASEMPEGQSRTNMLAMGQFLASLTPNEKPSTRALSAVVTGLLQQLEAERDEEPFELSPVSGDHWFIMSMGMQAWINLGLESQISDADVFDIAEFSNKSLHRIDSQFMNAAAHMPNRAATAALQQLHRLREDSRLLERRLLEKYVQRALMPSDGPDATLQQSTWLTMQRLQRISSTITRLRTGLASTKIVRISPVRSLIQLRANLASGERYLTQFSSVGKIFSLCVSPERIWIGQVPLDSPSIATAVKVIHAALSNPSPPSVEVDSTFPLSHAQLLSDSFLLPVAECLRGASDLAISLPPELAGISPHVLLDPLAGSQKSPVTHRSTPWLGLSYSVRVVSGHEQIIAAASLGKRDRTAGVFVGFGDPALNRKAPDGQAVVLSALRGAAPTSLGDLTQLEELPETSDELRMLATAFGGSARIRLREEATELALRRASLREARVLAFATHGLVRAEVTGILEPALVLTPGRTDSPVDDGLLTANDISRLDLNADLVILSACNSAKFDLALFGREAASLSSAFFLAGARATLASLWSIDSDAARHLIGAFGNEYAKGTKTPAQALKAAMGSFLADIELPVYYQHPRFWAAFTVYGDSALRKVVQPDTRKLTARSEPTLLERDGLISDALARGENIVVAGATPVVGSDVSEGFVEHLDSKLNPIWSHRESGRFFSLAPSGREGLFHVLASPAPNNPIRDIEIREYFDDGRLNSKASFLTPDSEFVGSTLLMKNGNLVISSAPIPGSGDRLNIHRVRSVDPLSGTVFWEWRAPASDVNVLRRSFIRPAGMDEIWVVVVDNDLGSWESSRLNDVGLFEPCFSTARSVVFRLDLKTRTERARYVIERAWVSDILEQASGQVLLALDRYDNCGRSHSGVARLSQPDDLLLSTKDFYGLDVSQLRLEAGSDGILVIGMVNRLFDSAETLIDPMQKPRLDPVRDADLSQQTGILVAKVNEDYRLDEADVIFTGLSSFIDAISWQPQSRSWLGFGMSADKQFGITVMLH